jgi:hypothetical protein
MADLPLDPNTVERLYRAFQKAVHEAVKDHPEASAKDLASSIAKRCVGKVKNLAHNAERYPGHTDRVTGTGTYNDERWCDNCNRETPHECYDSGHERDSSSDWHRCTICLYTWSGYTGRQYPPDPEP